MLLFWFFFFFFQEQKKYRGQARSDNPPHIFAVADAAYQALLHQHQSQAIVISGESGAGKTESANLLLKQLVFLGQVSNGLKNGINDSFGKNKYKSYIK